MGFFFRSRSALSIPYSQKLLFFWDIANWPEDFQGYFITLDTQSGRGGKFYRNIIFGKLLNAMPVPALLEAFKHHSFVHVDLLTSEYFSR